MTTAHTPGPWFVTGEGLSRYVEAKINGALIQEVAWCGATLKDEQEDNARLIAAAPELLEVLQVIAADSRWTSGEPLLMQVRAAIAKATGAA